MHKLLFSNNPLLLISNSASKPHANPNKSQSLHNFSMPGDLLSSVNKMEARKVPFSAAKQKIAKLSISDSFVELPPSTSATCSSVMPEDFEKPQIGLLSKASRTDIIQELNDTVKTLHGLLMEHFPATHGTLPAECVYSDDLLSVTHNLNNCVASLKETLSKTSLSSRRAALSNARVKEAPNPDYARPSVLDKVFTKQAVSFTAEETQALASVFVGAIRNSASEDLKKRIAVLQSNYVQHSEELLQLRKQLRNKDDTLHELTKNLNAQVKEYLLSSNNSLQLQIRELTRLLQNYERKDSL